MGSSSMMIDTNLLAVANIDAFRGGRSDDANSMEGLITYHMV